MTDLASATADAPADGRRFSVTDSAARRIAHLIAQEGNAALMLRLSVSGGGCSGFQYGFSFDDTRNPDDTVFTQGDATVVVDDCSLDLLGGGQLDYVEDLMGASFQIRNPNATSSCGCGSSFAIS